MVLAAGLWIVNASLAAVSNMHIPSAQALYERAVRDAEPKGKGTGEGFCWHAAYHMRAFVEAYRASHDPAWLDAGVKYYDWCVGKMAVGPDGKDEKCVLYKGKIGSGMNGQSDTLIFTWDGADPATKAKLPKGNYTVRWTVQDGCRDYVVTIPE